MAYDAAALFHPDQNPSFARVFGQETVVPSPPPHQQSTRIPSTPKQPTDEFSSIVFNHHPRHTQPRQCKICRGPCDAANPLPPFVLPLLAGRWHQPEEPAQKSAKSSMCINDDRSKAVHLTAQQEQQRSKLIHQQYKWRSLLPKSKHPFDRLIAVPTPQLSKPSSRCQQLGLQIL